MTAWTVPVPAAGPPPPPPPPPPVVRPRRPPAPGAVVARAAAAGLVAATLVPGHRLGAGTVVTALALAAAAPARARLASPYGATLGPLGGALVLVAALRDAEWVVALCLLGALICWSLLLSGADGWLATVRGAVEVPLRCFPAFSWLARALPGLVASERRAAAAPAVRGALVATLLLVVFGVLFASADAAFGELLSRLAPPAPGPDLGGRAVVLVAVAVRVGAATLVAAAPRVSAGVPPYAGRALRPVEWVLPLVVLDLLFAAFVSVQLAVLFGGRDHVLSTAGLTYAEYARQGFGQLVVAAVLTLGVVAISVRLVPRTPGSKRLLQLLLAVLCLLTLVVLGSASRRLGLYEQEFGFTRLRLSVDATIAWLAAALVLVVVAGLARGRAWLPRALVLSAAAGLLLFAVSDPDARIAERNVDRFEATGDVDADYLAELSADAVPALQGLPEPERSCLQQWRGTVEADSWSELNRARARAREALRERRPGACSLDRYDGSRR